MSASETNGIPGNSMIPPGRDPHNLASKRSSSVLARAMIVIITDKHSLYLEDKSISSSADFLLSAHRVSKFVYDMIQFRDQAVAYQHFY